MTITPYFLDPSDLSFLSSRLSEIYQISGGPLEKSSEGFDIYLYTSLDDDLEDLRDCLDDDLEREVEQAEIGAEHMETSEEQDTEDEHELALIKAPITVMIPPKPLVTIYD